MEAFRNIYTVQNNTIMIELPAVFKNMSVEVIVLPVDNSIQINAGKSVSNNKQQQLNELLTIGVWNNSDIKPISETNNLMNQWEITEY